jgi:hypothetical protein
VEAAATRISQASERSRASPYAMPCRTAMTGFSQASTALMQAWNSRMCRRSALAVRAGSASVRPMRPPEEAA